MELTNKNIEDYIDRFMEGETTNAEEQAIYRFFRSGDVPKHLEPYRKMFAWYENGLSEEKQEESKPAIRKRFHIPVMVWSAGIAAMVVLVVGLGIIAFSGEDHWKSEEWACYEGSYVEVSGKRITDVKQIMPCILETLQQAEGIERLTQERIEAIRRSEMEIKEKERMINY